MGIRALDEQTTARVHRQGDAGQGAGVAGILDAGGDKPAADVGGLEDAGAELEDEGEAVAVLEAGDFVQAVVGQAVAFDAEFARAGE